MLVELGSADLADDPPLGEDEDAVDPLDGSSNIDTNAPIGTIFSILPLAGFADDPAAALLQSGRAQLAAGFLVYGPQTSLVLSFGQAASSGTSTAATASSSSTASAISTGTPLWVGGTPTAASAGPYNLQITGSIYYTSTPSALAACTKATAAQSTAK